MLLQQLRDRAAGGMRRLFVGLARVLQFAADYFDLFWCVYAYLHLVLAYFKDRDLDIIRNYQALVRLSGNNKNAQPSS